MSFSGKTAITNNYLQTHPKCKSWGCFGKFRIFATSWALRFSKLKKKWLRKWSLKLPTPPPKMGRILCSQYTLIDPLSHALGHYGPWTWHIRPTAKGTKLPLLYLLPMCGTGFAFIASHENAEGHQRSAYCEQWILPIFWRGVGNFRLHFLSHFFFNFENLSAHLVANILNFPKHPLLLHFGWVWG